MKQKINVRLIGIAVLAVLATLICMTCVYYSLFQKQVRKDLQAVSYTHLTLPTSLEV